jgi:long-chain acyl-CoA synthetase
MPTPAGNGRWKPEELIVNARGMRETLEGRFAGHAGARAVWTHGDWLTYRQLDLLVQLVMERLRPILQAGDVLTSPGDDFDFLLTYLASARLDALVSCSRAGESWTAPTAALGGSGAMVRRSLSNHGVEGFAVLCMTSGTSGVPKQVLLDGDACLWGAWNTAALALELTRATAFTTAPVAEQVSDVDPLGLALGVGMPLRSIAGLTAANRALLCGEALVIPDSLTAEDVWAAVVRSGATNVGVPPFTAGQLLRHLSSNTTESGLLSLGIGGGAMSPEIAAGLERRLECPVTSGYGTTEVGGTALMPRVWDSEEVRWNTVGQPIGAVEGELRPHTDSDVQVLWLRSPAAMTGTVAADGSLHPRKDDWICTSDLASMDDQGNITIHGRADFVIQRGGRRIDPSTIEFALEADDSISRAGVCGVPSRVPGEQDVVAAVVPRTPRVDPFEIRRTSQTRLPVHLVPRRVLVVDELPLATDGNLARRRLADLVAELIVDQRETD